MGKATYKVEGGKMIKVELTPQGGRVKRIKITGDFFLHPEELIEEIENMLVGSTLEEETISSTIEEFMEKRGAVLLGATPSDLARCILMAAS